MKLELQSWKVFIQLTSFSYLISYLIEKEENMERNKILKFYVCFSF